MVIKNIISNIPIWNFSKICSGQFKDKMNKVSKKYNKSWGAMTYYFSVKLKKDLDSLYYQIHSNNLKKFIDSESLFFSFSSKNDPSRARDGFRAVTVSLFQLILLKNKVFMRTIKLK